MGRPLANCRVLILDAGGAPAPIGVAGELCIGGVGLARGYLHRADLTAEKFVRDPFGAPGERLYRTGDLARWRSDGQLEFVGRVDHQVKVRGFRIELGEIEAVLASAPDVEQAVVLAVGDATDKRLVAYLTATSDPAPEAERLRAHVAAHVPPYMVPKTYVTLDEWPLTPNGKLDRKALPEPDASPDLRPRYVAPRTPVEELLAGLWEDLLDVAPIGVDDDFFDLGGHSLRVTQLLARLRSESGVELPLRTAYEHPTVAGMASAVSDALMGHAADQDIDALFRELELADSLQEPPHDRLDP